MFQEVPKGAMFTAKIRSFVMLEILAGLGGGGGVFCEGNHASQNFKSSFGTVVLDQRRQLLTL